MAEAAAYAQGTCKESANISIIVFFLNVRAQEASWSKYIQVSLCVPATRIYLTEPFEIHECEFMNFTKQGVYEQRCIVLTVLVFTPNTNGFQQKLWKSLGVKFELL